MLRDLDADHPGRDHALIKELDLSGPDDGPVTQLGSISQVANTAL